MDRRRFLKYAGTTAAVVGASALGLDYVLSPQLRPLNPSATISNQTTSKFNFPPNAYLMYKPKYLNPTDQQTIQFTNLSSDVENDPLSYRWLVDGQPASQEKDYSTKLPVGQHEVDLEVSDPSAKSTVAQTITVEPDQIYPTKRLRLECKGMDYAAARHAPEFTSTPIPTVEEMDEQLSTIHDELGCNGISLYCGGGFEDNLVKACKLAVQKGFERIYAHVQYMHVSLDETVERIGNLAPTMKTLRESSDSIVWAIGAEFLFAVKDIIPGDTFNDQIDWNANHHDAYIQRMRDNIPEVFRRVLPVVRSKYGYQVAYRAEVNEAAFVPWSDPIFESICLDAYLQDAYGIDEQALIDYFSRYKRFGKPVIASEFGSMTFKGANSALAVSAPHFADAPYDEDEQATGIGRYCNMLNKANIEGAFCYLYNEEWNKGWGLYNGKKRKKGFYMYKSYQRAS